MRNTVRFSAKLAFGLAFVLSSQLLLADVLTQTNLVSDIAGEANTTDPNLKNPWGVSFSPTSPFWISNQGSGTSTLYDGAGNITPLVVTIPGGTPPASGPTGQVFNSTAASSSPGFMLSDGKPANFIFDTLNGTIAGWNGGAGTSAMQVASTAGAVYTGLAMGSAGGSNYLYAADSTGQVRVFNSSFQPVTLSGNFADPNAIAGYVPFNIMKMGSNLYVTYAQLTAAGTGLPGGYVDEFDTSGNFVKRVASGGSLYAPWDMALAPANFGGFGGDLLIGNFGNGEILAYNATTDAFVGTLMGADGKPIVNDFLWSLDFRTGGTNVNTDALYFTAGINNQKDGLFGEITSTPEPGMAIPVFLGLAALMLFDYRSRALR